MILDKDEVKTVYGDGALRASGNGKGRFDLVPLDILDLYMNAKFSFDTDKDTLYHIATFQKTGDTNSLFCAIDQFRSERDWDVYDVAMALAKRFEEGEVKYPSTVIDGVIQLNAMRGLPLSTFIDSGARHYIQWKKIDSLKDSSTAPEIDIESHDGAIVWNLIMAIWTMCYRKDMINIHFEGFNSGKILTEKLPEVG